MRESLRKLHNDRRYEKSMQYSDLNPSPHQKKTQAESYLLSTQYYGIVDFLPVQFEVV